jgi:NTP pyrophosphatase (non-canonical NTP hydrolase)
VRERAEQHISTLDRDWDKFHTPKNLAVSISIEAGELLEAFQWLESGTLDEPQKLPASRLRTHQE